MYVFIYKKRIKISTKQRIHPTLWDPKKQFITKSDRLIHKYAEKEGDVREQVLLVKKHLNELCNEVHRYSMVCQLQNKPLQLYELRERLYDLLDKRNTSAVNRNSIVAYLQNYIDQLKNGDRKKPNMTKYSIGTVKNYKNLLQALERYENDRVCQLTWDSVDRIFYGNFLDWHLENGCSQNYTGKHLKDFKALMKIAYEEGVHTNTEYTKRYFIVPYKKQKKIPLSLSEVNQIENLDTSDEPKLSLPKDIFLLGCYLGLRVSDIKRISSKNIQRYNKRHVLVMTTQKTGKEVKIPINTKAEKILAKYDFKCPCFCEQVVNRHLKLIGKKIGLSPLRAKKLTIHISRHTFAKLSYDLGIPPMHIMSVTGHTSERHFLQYINVQPEEAVREFVKFDFFK